MQLEKLGLSAQCAEVVRHLWEYLDAEMTPESAERLRAHIAVCEQCKEYELYQGCFLQAVARLREHLGAPAPLRERLAEGLKNQGCGCWSEVRAEQE
jgi:anti-sigma factor (TIGR02949 family)